MTRINTNIGSLVAQKNLRGTNIQLQQALTRLSTGLRINSGKDDPAGLIASEILGSDIVSTQKAITNSERANQMLATADSALGQISNLLHDIRGLIEEAANSGAMSEEQIAANQLQIDAGLQSVNRVAQTTQFQGQGLLNGSLDFITNASTIPDIKSLRVNQATIGATGQLNVNVEIQKTATQASIQSASGDTKAVAALTFAPRTALVLNGAGTSTLSITASTVGPQMEGVKVTLTDTGTASATYNAETKILALTFNAGTTTAEALATEINGLAATDSPAPFYAEGAAVAADSLVSGGDELVASKLVFTAKTAGADFNGVKVKVQGGTAAGAQWNAAAKEIILTLDNTADSTLDALTTAVAASSISNVFDVTNVAGGSGAATTTDVFGLTLEALETKPVTNSTISGYLRSGFSAATQAMASISFAPIAQVLLKTDAATDATIDIQSKSLEEGTGVLISMVDDNSVTQGTEYAVYNAAAKTLDVHYDGGTSTVKDVLAAVNKLDGWTATQNNAYEGTTTLVTDDGSDPATTSLTVTSPLLEKGAGDITITYVNTAAIASGDEYAVYDNDARTLKVYFTTTVATVDDIANAIKRVDGFDASYTSGEGAYTVTSGPSTTAAALTAETDVVDATGQESVKTVVDKLQVASLNPGANYNNMQVRFEGKAGLTDPIASYDAVKNEMVIQIDTASIGNSQFQKIVTAINNVQAGGMTGAFSANWITPDGGVNYIYGAAKDVYAVGNTASSGGNTLLADMVVEVAGANGGEAFNFGVGTSANQIASALNLASDSTGVWAAQDNGLLSIKSNGYGSKYFSAASVTNEGVAGTFKTGLSASRATGTNAVAKINGVTAVADGNYLSIATSTLDMGLDVAAEKLTSFNFSITGGGALFQLGPDVVANQQARLGIASVNTSQLGGASGKLYLLGNGQAASLKNNVGLAAKIADDAVTSIINLRGRLGAFQKTTLDTNIAALSDTAAALVEAQGAIRDADFAAETANLTRAQVLTQSGMAILGVANQQPQNVLSLLRNL